MRKRERERKIARMYFDNILILEVSGNGSPRVELECVY